MEVAQVERVLLGLANVRTQEHRLTDLQLDHYDRRTGRFTYYRSDPNVEQTLSGGFVLFTLEDASGTLWVCTEGTGLNSSRECGSSASIGTPVKFPIFRNF